MDTLDITVFIMLAPLNIANGYERNTKYYIIIIIIIIIITSALAGNVFKLDAQKYICKYFIYTNKYKVCIHKVLCCINPNI